jgi:hypothetical protein
MSQLDLTANYVNGLPGINLDIIALSGFKPIKTTESKAVIPAIPTGVKLQRGVSTEMFADSDAMPGAVFYGGILIPNNPLPDGYTISNGGQLLIYNPDSSKAKADTTNLMVAFDFTKNRKKHFIGLTKGVEYYYYSYAGNAAGVSQFSEGVMLMCG